MIRQKKIRTLVFSAIVFAVAYAFIEYYVIRDTTFGYSPVLFSLVYPYHFAMAAIFGLVAYFLLHSANTGVKSLAPTLIMAGALISSMLVVEDFSWFVLRAIAPIHHDINAGRLISEGEWTTRFMGSTDAYFTAIPNWYFVNIIFSATSIAIIKTKQFPTTEASSVPPELTS